MKKAIVIFLVFCLLLTSVFAEPLEEAVVEEVKTVKPLEGYGTETRGGLDGRIIKVTNLNSDGPGSFKEAVTAEGPRVVVFEVGGVIDLDKQQIKINNPYLTIAGQTAPSPGITLIRGGITFNTHDVVMQHIRVRMGDAGAKIGDKFEPEISTAGNGNSYNIVVDHCSVSWGVDENLSISGKRGKGKENASRNITYSNNFISEGLAWSVHSKQTMNHSMGTLVMDDCSDISIIGNYYAHNYERNPWFKGSSSGLVVNNLIYDPGAWAIRLSWIPKEWKDLEERPVSPMVSIVGNYEKEGPSTTVVAMVGSNYPENDERGYLEDNIIVKEDGVTEGKITDESIPITLLDEKPIWIDGLSVLKAEDVPSYVLRYSGARPLDRDETDKRLVAEFYYGTGAIINSQNEVGGYPEAEETYRELDPIEGTIEEWLEKYTLEVMPSESEMVILPIEDVVKEALGVDTLPENYGGLKKDKEIKEGKDYLCLINSAEFSDFPLTSEKLMSGKYSVVVSSIEDAIKATGFTGYEVLSSDDECAERITNKESVIAVVPADKNNEYKNLAKDGLIISYISL